MIEIPARLKEYFKGIGFIQIGQSPYGCVYIDIDYLKVVTISTPNTFSGERYKVAFKLNDVRFAKYYEDIETLADGTMAELEMNGLVAFIPPEHYNEE